MREKPTHDEPMTPCPTALAIERGESLASERQAEAYRHLSGVLASGAALRDLADLIASSAMTLLGTDGAAVVVIDGDDIEYVGAVGAAQSLLGRRAPYAASFADRVLDAGTAVRFELDATDGPPSVPDGVDCLLATPLHVSGVSVGVLGVAAQHPRRFRDRDVAELAALGDYIALGLERVHTEAEIAQADRLHSLADLAAAAAHEILNPLSSVHINIDYLSTALMSVPEIETRIPDIRSLLDETAQGLRRVTDIVQDLRMLSRSEASASREMPQTIDVNAEIERAVDVAGTAVREVATLDVYVETGLPPVAGAAGRVAQVMVNLLQNAAQAIQGASPDGHQVRVRASADDNTIRITVSDTGRGIAASQQSRVFEPFFTTRRPGRGTGLGLTMAWRFVNSLRGTLRIESSEETGTTARIALPVLAPHARSM